VIDDLYSARILSLAANIPRIGRLPAPQASVEKASKVCGSRVVVDLNLQDGRVSDFAQEVQACALGQTSAAVLGAHAMGATVEELQTARDRLRAYLKGEGPAPDGRFSELSVLGPVREFPARHASVLLAFECAAEAAVLARGRAAPG